MQCSSFTPPDSPQPQQAGSFTPNPVALHADLLRYARSRLHNVALAEDAVSETLLAAWQSKPSFPTQAQATAWVYGILRHKLVDQLRHQSRETPAGDGLPEADTRGLDWFVKGGWCGVASFSAEPDQACSQNQFVALVLRCCEQLSPLQRQAFVLRELHDLEPADICRQLRVTDGHLWVLVHRARLRLRTMLCKLWLLPREAEYLKTPARLQRARSVQVRMPADQQPPSTTAGSSAPADLGALQRPLNDMTVLRGALVPDLVDIRSGVQQPELGSVGPCLQAGGPRAA